MGLLEGLTADSQLLEKGAHFNVEETSYAPGMAGYRGKRELLRCSFKAGTKKQLTT